MTFAEVLADAVSREQDGQERVLIREGDPFVLAAAVAARTATIRVGVAVDTARTHPYVAARKLAALDKISDGRAEWLPEDTEPARRDEAVRLVEALLASWGPGATVNDKAGGVHVDTDRITAVHHDGRWWSVHSPLDVPAGPQGVVPRVAS